MNPEYKACWRPTGPNCRYRTGPLRSVFTGTECTKYPGLYLGGGVSACSYYKPSTFWDDFWCGVTYGAIVGLIAICFVALGYLAVEVIKA